MSAVRSVGLTRAYGSLSALQGVDLDVPAGSLFGLVGPNGSGKTTLIEILAGLRRSTAGTLHLSVRRDAIAYCPDVAEFEPWLSAIEVLHTAVGLLGRRRQPHDLMALLVRVGLGEVARRRVGDFSRGMTTRLNLAAALAGNPALLLLDEPAAALDPAGRGDMLRLIASFAPATTVVVSSHDLAEIEAICSHVGILAAGRLLYQGSLAGLLAGAARPRWRLVVRPPAGCVLAALSDAAWVTSVTETVAGELEFDATDAAAVEVQLVGLLAACNARIVSLAPVRPSLDEVFLSLTSRSTDPLIDRGESQ